MVDGYTKTMLTIIAAATMAIGYQLYLRDQTYAAVCGEPKIPCFVNTPSGTWLAVRVIPPDQQAP